MKCELTRNLPVRRFAAFAELAFLEPRPELAELCRAARKTGGKITVATVGEVLPGISGPGAGNVVHWCRHIGLCDSQGGLTLIGERAADTNEVPVPEQGVYDFWAVDHALTRRRLLHVDRLAPKKDSRFDGMDKVPFRPKKETHFDSAVNADLAFVFRTFPGDAHCHDRSTSAVCRIRWRFDFARGTNEWHLDGQLDPTGGRLSIRKVVTSWNVDVEELFASWADEQLRSRGRWERDHRVLAVRFAGLSKEEQESFLSSVEIPSPDVPGVGTFDSTVVHQVPIGPQTRKDSTAWATTRLERCLREQPGYRTRSQVRALFAELVEATPLEDVGADLSSHEEVLGGFSKDPELYWALAAPVDLAPFPVEEDELETLEIGEGVAVTPRGANGVVRVPHGASWSMQDLVVRLLDGVVPQRVCLCDRYIRGERNLAGLRLFRDAARNVKAGLRIAALTEESGDNLAQIKSVLGVTPKTYSDAFGSQRRYHPHARYLLVDAGHDSFAWQMDNSPLDARSEDSSSADSPLSWRDFGAFRIEREQLPESLLLWFGEGAA